MIYLDNSATTNPKPQSVIKAADIALRMSANPGRSSHSFSVTASERIYNTRNEAARFFGIENEEQVIFTPNCTFALNTAIKSYLKNGGHAVVSELEHNAVMRPLEKLKSQGVTFTKAKVFINNNDKTVDSFRNCINENTKLIVCTHASNVFGLKLPARRLCALAHTYGIPFVLDAAQSAGVTNVNLTDDGYDIVCAAPHKGLYSPMGTGLLLLNKNISPDTLTEGGTGSNSLLPHQPEELPDKFESGTVNYSGIAGMGEGIRFVRNKGIDRISAHEFKLISRLWERLSKINNIILYTPCPEPEHFVPILSFNIKDKHSEETAAFLHKNGFAVRAGLHCAPSAHQAFGTTETGTVRISPSVFTTERDIDRLVFTIKQFR